MGFTLLGILNAQAAGAQVPEPAFLDSAPVWFDAADTLTITASSGSVSQWDNKGTGENLVQATSADQPTTGVSTVNNLNVIDFDDDFFVNSTRASWKFLHDGTAYFVAAVIKYGVVASPGESYALFATNIGSASQIGAALAYQDQVLTSDRHTASVTNGSSHSIETFDDDFLTPNQVIIHSDRRVPLDSTAANRYSYFQNQTVGPNNNSSTAGVSSSNPTQDFTLGAIRTDGLQALVGQIGEFIIVSGADATETNRQATVDYLNSKWGVF